MVTLADLEPDSDPPKVLIIGPDEVAAADYDVDAIRRRGRPSIGSGPAQLVPVRLDPELLESLRLRALRDHASNSEIIRAALREYLAS